MKGSAVRLRNGLAAAVLMLAACGDGRGGEDRNEAAPQPNPAAAPSGAGGKTAEQPPGSAPAAMSRDRIVGRWATEDDCDVNPYRFEDDNSIYRHGGNEVGTWALRDDGLALDLDDPPGTGTATFETEDRMTASVGGRSLVFTRCPL